MSANDVSTATYRERLDAATARQPTCCPVCGSALIQPMFIDDADVWDCAEAGCWSIWKMEA